MSEVFASAWLWAKGAWNAAVSLLPVVTDVLCQAAQTLKQVGTLP